GLAKRLKVRRPRASDPDSTARTALVDFCESGQPALTTAGVMQHFAGTPFEQTLVGVLTAGESEALAGELLEVQLVEGVKRYWLNAQKRGMQTSADGLGPDLSPEEAERARQRQLMRDRLAGGP